jgi:hypothetical protein
MDGYQYTSDIEAILYLVCLLSAMSSAASFKHLSRANLAVVILVAAVVLACAGQ